MAKGIEIAKGYVQIVPSAKGIKGSLEKELSNEASNAGNHGGTILGDKLVGALKTAMAAAGIGKIIQSALSEGGKLQQSYGGLETIYGDAAEAAKKYAEQAYAAGISANDYAEQAVSFGASLKQAFGGDTAAAVEAANTAIMDMTDNAAKMGTPLESIQNAYQGFAKQNYTMLDNLKLGYGGTKKEMERLLADASKLEAANGRTFDINKLGDVYEAIHLVQGELGLTGVAASEASTTFTGSMGAMQAALSNFMGALSTGGDIEGPLLALIGNAGVFIQNNLFPMLTQIMTSIPGVLQIALPALYDAITGMIGSIITMVSENGPQVISQMTTFISGLISQVVAAVPGFIQTTLPTIISALMGILTAVSQSLSTVSLESGADVVNKIVEGILQMLPSLMSTGGDMALKLISAIGQKAPQMIAQASKLLNNFLDTILKELPNILKTGADVVTKLSEGLAQAIPSVVAAAGKAIADFLSTILSNLPSIVDSGINLLTKLAEGINRNSQALIYAAANAIKHIVSTIAQHLPDIVESGVKIIAFLVTGLARQIPNVLTTIAALITDIVRSFSEYDWGELGTRILEGLANGLKAGVGMVAEAAKNAAKSAFEAAKDFLGIESPSRLFRDEVGEMMAEGMAIGFEDNVPTAEIQNALKPMANVVPEMNNGYNYGGFTINVYGAPGQDVSTLADIISDRINASIRKQEAVFA